MPVFLNLVHKNLKLEILNLHFLTLRKEDASMCISRVYQRKNLGQVVCELILVASKMARAGGYDPIKQYGRGSRRSFLALFKRMYC